MTNAATEAAARMIRPALPADLEALLNLEAAFPGDRLSRRALRHHLASPRAVCLVADDAGRLEGYALLLSRTRSRWWRLYSLIRAGDAPPGTGSCLLEAALQAARAAGALGVRLEVRQDNTRAIRLYRAHGFTLFSTVADYYDDGATALRMALAFAT